MKHTDIIQILTQINFTDEVLREFVLRHKSLSEN